MTRLQVSPEEIARGEEAWATAPKGVQELAIAIRKHAPKGKRQARGIAGAMYTVATRMHTIAEHACNRELSPREVREDGELDAAFKALCSYIGCRARLNGDPRGYVASVLFPDGAYNSWGGAECGWGVSTRGDDD
jgi:hypothetical protein